MPGDGSLAGVTSSTSSAAAYPPSTTTYSAREFVAESPSSGNPQLQLHANHPRNTRYSDRSPSLAHYQQSKADDTLDTTQQASSRFGQSRDSLTAQQPDNPHLISPQSAGYHSTEGSSYYQHSGYYQTSGHTAPYSSAEHNEAMAATHMRPLSQIYHASTPMSPGHGVHEMPPRNMYPPSTYNPHVYLPTYPHSAHPPSYQYHNVSQGSYPDLPNLRSSYGLPHQQGSQTQFSGFNTNQGLVQNQFTSRGDFNHMSPGAMVPVRSPTGGPSGQGHAGPLQPSAAPGPIPATTPLVIKHDDKGVKHIEFEYSRDRIKTNHTIRCDIDSVDQGSLSQKFKEENCVYPRACGPKSTYTGNRYNYETECNGIGWALAYLNEPLQGRRGLIQRAVDSWRNSNPDLKMRSRRVRRLAKTQKRTQQQTQHQSQSQAARISGMGMMPDRPGPTPQRPSLTSVDTAQYAAPIYPSHRHPHSASSAPGGAPFQDSYQSPLKVVDSSSFPGGLTSTSRDLSDFPGPPTASALNDPQTTAVTKLEASHELLRASPYSAGKTSHDDGIALLRNLDPSIPRRYSVSVADNEHQRTPRARFDIDNVDVAKIEDSYRARTAVWPRSFVSRTSLFHEGEWADPGSTGAIQATSSQRTSRLAPDAGIGSSRSALSPGTEDRAKEAMLNDMGSQLAHEKPRTFDQRPLLLQKSLDACRSQISTHLTQAGVGVPSFLKQRVGKQIWQNRPRIMA